MFPGHGAEFRLQKCKNWFPGTGTAGSTSSSGHILTDPAGDGGGDLMDALFVDKKAYSDVLQMTLR